MGKRAFKKTQGLLTLEAISQTSQKNLSGSISEENMEQLSLGSPYLMDSNTIPPQLKNSTVSILDLVHMI